MNLRNDGRILFAMFAVSVSIHVYCKKDDDDDLCNADCSLIGGLSLTASRKKNNLIPLLGTDAGTVKSTAKMVSSVATKRNFRHLTCL